MEDEIVEMDEVVDVMEGVVIEEAELARVTEANIRHEVQVAQHRYEVYLTRQAVEQLRRMEARNQTLQQLNTRQIRELQYRNGWDTAESISEQRRSNHLRWNQ